MLATIYSHLDSTTTVGAVPTKAAALENRSDWGREVATSHGGRASTFVRELGGGRMVVTFVIWA